MTNQSGIGTAVGTAVATGGSNLPFLLAGGAADIILSFLGGMGADDQAQLDRDAKLKIASDALGFNYAELKAKSDQYYAGLKTQVDQFLATNKLDKATLAEKIRAGKVGEAQGQSTINMGLSDRFSKLGDEQAQSQRTAKIAQNFAGMPKAQAQPKPYVYPGAVQPPPAMPGPNLAVTPTANPATKTLGTQALGA